MWLFCLAIEASADLVPMNGAEVAPNVAEIRVSEDGVHIQLEVFFGDIPKLEELVPDSWYQGEVAGRADEQARMAAFSENGLSIRRSDGSLLSAVAKVVEPRMRIDRSSPLAGQRNPLTGQVYPAPPEDQRVLYAELFYDFEGQMPEHLVFSPPSDQEGNPLVTIGMVVFDRDVPVIDFRYLSGPAELTIDWDDPWYSGFANPNLSRHHRFPYMAFLYAEPYEIRHEALLRVRDTAELIGLSVDGKLLSETDLQRLEAELPSLFRAKSQMEVDGRSVSPDFERLSYMRIGTTGLEFLEKGEDIDRDATIVGLIYSAPTDQFAKNASVEWTVFPASGEPVPGQSIDKAGPLRMDLTPSDPVLTWTNHFKKPPYPEVTEVLLPTSDGKPIFVYALSVICLVGFGSSLIWVVRRSDGTRRIAMLGVLVGMAAAAAIPYALEKEHQKRIALSEEEMIELAETLLGNVYRAFDFKQEDHVYDRLAKTLASNVLEEVYLDQRKALRVERAGGAQARVEALEVMAAERLSDTANGSIRMAVDWNVSGKVGHWGHTHQRANSYNAELVIQPVQEAWKIIEFNVLQQERLF